MNATKTLEDESIISLVGASRLLPEIDGRRPSPETVRLWIHRGVRGQRLEGARVGVRIITSKEAVGRFLRRLNDGEQS